MTGPRVRTITATDFLERVELKRACWLHLADLHYHHGTRGLAYAIYGKIGSETKNHEQQQLGNIERHIDPGDIPHAAGDVCNGGLDGVVGNN